jgi:hypothetical protein
MIQRTTSIRGVGLSYAVFFTMGEARHRRSGAKTAVGAQLTDNTFFFHMLFE